MFTMTEKRKEWYRNVARDMTNAEVEEFAVVRDAEASEGGAWVEAWVWVTQPDDEDEDAPA